MIIENETIRISILFRQPYDNKGYSLPGDVPFSALLLLPLKYTTAMRRFDNTGLWKLLQASSHPATASATGLDSVLEEFIGELHNYCRDEMNIGERTRSLNYARSELDTYADGYESKKRTPIRRMIGRAMNFIDSELGMIEKELKYPDRFIVFPEDHPPLARWNGKVTDLIEYFIGPQAAGVLLNPNGKPMNYEESVEFLEKTFGIKIAGPADRRAKVLDRQKNTTFQDEMRRTFLEEAKKRDL